MKNVNKILLFAFPLLVSTLVNAQTANTDIPTVENVEIVNEKTVNAANLDFSPTFYEDGIVFLTSTPEKENSPKVQDKKIKEKTFTIKVVRRGPQGVLTAPQTFATELTSRFHEGPLCFDKTTENVFFSRNNSEGDKPIDIKCEATKVKCARQQIYTSAKVGEKWSEPKKISINKGEYAFRHPALSLDGKKLYFSSDMPGGQGGYDIWVSNKVGDEWGEPVNLGDKINTPSNEGFPFIHADGTLLYSSDGLGGVGALDIFYALSEKGKGFQKPLNLGYPFNSAGDDFGLILDLDRKNGYFTSNKPGGAGSDDIYSFSSPEPIINPKKKEKAVICVLDKADNSPIGNASVKYSNVSDMEIMDLSSTNKSENLNILQIAGTEAAQVIMTDSTCRAEFAVPEGEYLINVTKDGYSPKQLILKTKNDKDVYTVYLEKGSGQLVSAILKNDRGLPIPGALVTITDPETGETQTVTTDAEGRYSFVAKPNKKYAITANKPNHDPMTTTFETGNEIPKEFVFESKMKELVSPLKKGRVFELSNVYYNFNDASLRPDARRDLEALVTVMLAYPEVEIELGSHTDCRGSDAYNDDLSQRRAESVVNYLLEHGISKSKMVAHGYGEHKLRNQCTDGVECTEEEHQRNRRTEVTLTKGASNAEIVVVDKEPEYTDPMPGHKTGVHAATASNDMEKHPVDASIVVTPSDPNGAFWIVSGSFSNEKNALEQQEKMLANGFSETTVEYVHSIKFYRVVISKQSTIEAAESAARQLKDRGLGKLFVVKQ